MYNKEDTKLYKQTMYAAIDSPGVEEVGGIVWM